MSTFGNALSKLEPEGRVVAQQVDQNQTKNTHYVVLFDKGCTPEEKLTMRLYK